MTNRGRFGATWPGRRCGAPCKKTGEPCQGPAMANGRCRLHGGRSTKLRTEYTERVERIRCAAAGGDVEAQFELGLLFVDGKDVDLDYVEAVMWTRKAADKGHSSAQYNLGVLYKKGRGVQHDGREAPQKVAETKRHQRANPRHHRSSPEEYARCPQVRRTRP